MLRETFSLLGLRTAPARVTSRRTETQKCRTSLYLISLSVCLSPRPDGTWVVASSVLGLALWPEQLPGQLGYHGESACQQALGLGYTLIISPWVWEDVSFLSSIFFLILCGLCWVLPHPFPFLDLAGFSALIISYPFPRFSQASFLPFISPFWLLLCMSQ